MNFTETLKLAFSAIRAHKLRSFLTLLGMIIAVMTFMIVLSLLQGFSGYVDEKIAGIGSNTFTIRRFTFDDFKDTDSIAEAQRRNKELSFEELTFLKEHSQLIDKIGARALPNIRELKHNGQSIKDVQITGAEPIIAEIEKLDIDEGRYFTDAENANAMRVAYVGSDVANRFYPAGDAIGGEFSINGIPYRIIGIQTTKGSVFGQPQDNFVTLPIKTYGADFGGLTRSRGIYLVASSKDPDKQADTVEEVRTLMRIKRGQKFGEKDTFGILTPDAISGLIGRITKPIGYGILFIPTIALFVGAIVVMNIMLVAVTERTKEIGIRKSLGARQSDILRQFLFESSTLATVGGIIGLVLAEIVGLVVSAFVFPTRIPIWAAILAIGIAGGVGILAGLYPAWKAARLDPIEALRIE